MTMDLDTEHIAEAAREALTRPSDSAWFDDRLFDTHGCVYTWADRSDDVLDESNFHAMLAALNGAVAHDETGASEERGDDVLDTSASHWAVGSVRHIFVRVYADEERTIFTPAFIEAVRCADSMREYPVLDESDFSEREYDRWQQIVMDAFDWAMNDYPDDTPAEREAVWHVLTGADRDGYQTDIATELFDSTYPDGGCDDHFERLVREARDEVFGYAARVAAGEIPMPGQLSLI